MKFTMTLMASILSISGSLAFAETEVIVHGSIAPYSENDHVPTMKCDIAFNGKSFRIMESGLTSLPATAESGGLVISQNGTSIFMASEASSGRTYICQIPTASIPK